MTRCLGTATTGRPHCGYFPSAIKIAQLLAAGCDVTILLADIHGFLDNLKAPLELVDHRATYYRFVISAILRSVGVPTDRLRFVLGSSYQKTPEYIMDVYKMTSLVSENDAKRAGAEVVKQTTNAPLSGLIYPILQVLDEVHLGVDAQMGGMDQRKLFVAATEWLPKLGYKVVRPPTSLGIMLTMFSYPLNAPRCFPPRPIYPSITNVRKTSIARPSHLAHDRRSQRLQNELQ